MGVARRSAIVGGCEPISASTVHRHFIRFHKQSHHWKQGCLTAAIHAAQLLTLPYHSGVKAQLVSCYLRWQSFFGTGSLVRAVNGIPCQ